jgi:hypothetical protein
LISLHSSIVALVYLYRSASAPMADQHTAAVLAALTALYSDPDAGAKKRANDWLEEFQHSVRHVAFANRAGTSLRAPAAVKAEAVVNSDSDERSAPVAFFPTALRQCDWS